MEVLGYDKIQTELQNEKQTNSNFDQNELFVGNNKF